MKVYTWAEFHELNEKLTASEKRYDALEKDRDEWRKNCKHRFEDNIELKKKYDSLLVLARRLRKAINDRRNFVDDEFCEGGCHCEGCKVMRDSAWLEE